MTRILGDLSSDEIVTQVENSNRILSQDTLLVGVDPIEALPDRDMVYNDVGRLFRLFEDGTLKAEYIYNADGQRTRKTVFQTDGSTVESITVFHYDLNGQLITETREDGTLVRDYIWLDNMPTAQIDNAGPENITYLHTDHLFTNRLATDQSTAVVWRWEGEAFGNTPAEEISGVVINLRFPGQYFDGETNLHYNWNRYYDPVLGRYITTDSIGVLGLLTLGNQFRVSGGRANLYAYGLNNPIVYIDRTGKSPTLVTAGIGALIGAGLNAVTNFNAFQSGRLTGADFAKSIIVGAGTGALAGLFPGFIGSTISGAVTSAANTSINQLLLGDVCRENIKDAAIAGAASGAVANEVAELVEELSIFQKPIIGTKPISKAGTSPKFAGGIIGLVAGTIVELVIQ